MAFNIKEGIRGLEHLRLAACRRLFRMQPDAFMRRYQEKPVPVEICCDTAGNAIVCERCGFVIIRATYANGWQMEMCSALPVVIFDDPKFNGWLTSLANGPAAGGGTADHKHGHDLQYR